MRSGRMLSTRDRELEMTIQEEQKLKMELRETRALMAEQAQQMQMKSRSFQAKIEALETMHKEAVANASLMATAGWLDGPERELGALEKPVERMRRILEEKDEELEHIKTELAGMAAERGGCPTCRGRLGAFEWENGGW